MKQFGLLLVFTLCLIFTSCEKDPDELTITMNNTGTLTFNIVDGATPLEGVKVTVYYSNSSLIAFEGISDASGSFTTDKLLEGYYSYDIVYLKNGIKYYEYKMVQVIAANNKIVKCDPMLNVGVMSIKVLNYRNDTPYVGANVALVPASISYSSSVLELIDKAHFTAKTNSLGIAKFDKVPASRDYRVIIYNDAKTNYNSFTYVYTIKNEEKEYTTYFY